MIYKMWITNVHESELNKNIIRHVLATGHYLGKPKSVNGYEVDKLEALGWQGLYFDVEIVENENEKKT